MSAANPPSPRLGLGAIAGLLLNLRWATHTNGCLGDRPNAPCTCGGTELFAQASRAAATLREVAAALAEWREAHRSSRWWTINRPDAEDAEPAYARAYVADAALLALLSPTPERPRGQSET